MPNLVQIRRFLEPCDLEIWWMTLKNNRAPILCYFKLYASFRSHQWIQAGVTVRKRPIWVKINDFFSRVTLQFDVWPGLTIEHLFYATSSFVHHFVAIGDFKLELQSGNTQIGSNSTIFRAVWPCYLTMTLKNNRAPLLCYFKLYASFIAIGELKLGLHSGNTQFGSKSTIFLSRVTLKFDVWPWKTIGHLFYAASNFVHHFVAIGDFKLELQSGNAQFGSNSTIFRAVWHWNLMYDHEKQ